MGYIEWVPALSVGIERIDEQHRRLIGLINRLEEARAGGEGREALGAALAELGDYAQEHFSLEEGLFAEKGYPAAREHGAEHAAFIERVAAFAADFAAGRAQVDAGLLAFLRSWLTGHISFSDKKYRRYLAG